ncbi:MAG: N-6 DNA methylase [FCB group bacterium]|nr:N-6 DNA methylase [FCB group bacterium]
MARKEKTHQFHQLTERYIKTTDIEYRKKMGQYFTPLFVRQHLLHHLPKTKAPQILDPACGTGEFLLSAQEYFENPQLYGWEIDPHLVNLSQRINPQAKIIKADALKKKYSHEKFDYVISNPPYYEFPPDKEIKDKFQEVIKGRSNIFSMFIKIGLEVLKPGGYLGFVVPPSMNNGAYFSNLRQYIIDNANIEYLKILSSSSLFHRALQTVMILILKKGKNKGNYIFKKNGITIFSAQPQKLSQAFQNKKTLKELGFTVSTGKVVWNQHKEELTNICKSNILLIWSHNITDKGLKLNHKAQKPQYIKSEKYDIGPAIVVNRIIGNVAHIKLKAAVVPSGVKFLGENHINVIYSPSDRHFNLDDICKQITSENTMETIKLITGNTQLSKTELAHLLPLKI